MDCPDGESLRRLCEGMLAGDELDRLTAHIEGCEPCQSTLDSLGAGVFVSLALLQEASLLPTQEMPASLGPYPVLGLLGQGGMGRVYLSRQPNLDRDLALKVIADALRGDRHAEKRFIQEANLTARLDHKNIVTVHDIGRLPDGRLYYTMRRIRGKTLHQLLAGCRSLHARLEYLPAFAEVCDAVAYAHERDTIHRDLKPANVMVSHAGEVQVMDWGLAKELGPAEVAVAPPDVDDDLATRGPLGTWAFAAPEQVAGDPALVGEPADVFGLGGILCFLLTGAPPYHGDDVRKAAREGDLGGALARLNRCGAHRLLVGLAKECLAREPESRPSAPEVTARVRAYLTIGERRPWRWVALVAAVAAAVGVGWLVLARSDQPPPAKAKHWSELQREAVAEGMAALREEAYPQAEAAFRRAVSHGDHDRWAHLKLGIALYRRGKRDEARDEVRSACQIANLARVSDLLNPETEELLADQAIRDFLDGVAREEGLDLNWTPD